MPRPTLSPTRAKSTVSRCFLQVTKIGGTLADSDTRREPGRLLSAMLTPQCCALAIAPARKDRVDNGLGRPGSGGDCILHSRWYLGEYLAAKPIGFEFAKLCCQRVLGDDRDRAPSAHR